VIEVSVQEEVQEEVKEINLHVKARKILREDVIQYLAEIDVDGAKYEIVVTPFKAPNLSFAHDELTYALNKLFRAALIEDERLRTEELNKALVDIGFALAYLAAYTLAKP